MISAVMLAERHSRAGSVHTTRAGICQVWRLRVTARLQDVSKRDEVALDIRVRVDEGVAHPRLGGQVDHAIEGVPSETCSDGTRVRQIGADELVPAPGSRRRLLEDLEPRLLEAGIVVVIHHVESDNRVALLEESLGRVKPNEARVASDENVHRTRRLNHDGVASSSTSKKSRAAPPGSRRARPAPWTNSATMIPNMPPASPPRIPRATDLRASPTTGSRGFSSTVITGVSRTSRILASSKFWSRDV